MWMLWKSARTAENQRHHIIYVNEETCWMMRRAMRLRVEKEQIERTIWTIWQEHCRLFATIPVASLYEQQIEKLRKQEKILKQSLERFPAEKINLYEQFCSSRVKQDMFLKEKDQLSKQEEVVRKEIEKVSGQIDMLEKRQKNYRVCC